MMAVLGFVKKEGKLNTDRTKCAKLSNGGPRKLYRDLCHLRGYFQLMTGNYHSGKKNKKKTKTNKQTNKGNKGVLVFGSSSRFLRKLRPWQKQRK